MKGTTSIICMEKFLFRDEAGEGFGLPDGGVGEYEHDGETETVGKFFRGIAAHGHKGGGEAVGLHSSARHDSRRKNVGEGRSPRNG